MAKIGEQGGAGSLHVQVNEPLLGRCASDSHIAGTPSCSLLLNLVWLLVLAVEACVGRP